MNNQHQQEFTHTEELRLQHVLTAIAENERERKEQIRAHDTLIRDLKKQRLDSVSPREKDRLTAEIRRLSNFDPAKYKLAHI